MMETYTPIVPYTSKNTLVEVCGGSSGLVSYIMIAIILMKLMGEKRVFHFYG